MRSFSSPLVILAAVAVLRIATVVTTDVYNQDECYIAMQAQVMNAGGELYRDVVDRKPPLVQHIYAGVFKLVGSDSLVAVHVLAIVWVAATALVLGAIARRRAGPRAGTWASWLFVLTSMALLPRDALAANFEIWMLLPLCTAMLVAGRGRLLGDLCAGVLLGVAVFMKQPALVTLAPLGLAIWSSPTRLRGLVALGLGLGLVATLVVAVHGEQVLVWAFFSTGGYLATGDIVYALRVIAIWTGSFLLATGALWWLVIRNARAGTWRADADLWLWLLTSFVGVSAGLRFFGHYHLQLLPAACILAAVPAAALTGHVRRRVIGVVVAPAVLCGALAFVLPNQPFDGEYRGVARYLRSHTSANERIFVWGHFPEIYWAAQRLPAIRFVHTGFMTGQSGARPIRPEDLTAATAGAWQATFEDLARNRPLYVVDLAPGRIRMAHHFPMERYPDIARWRAEHYHFETVVDGIWLYRRRD